MAIPVIQGTYTVNNNSITSYDITGVVIPSGLTDGLLVVGTSCEENSGTDVVVASVTIDPGGVNEAAFTKIDEQLTTNGTYYNGSSLWYLTAANIPPAGTYTVRVSYTSAVQLVVAGCYVLSGASQSSIPNAQNKQGATSSTGITTSLTTTAADCLLIDSYSQGDNNAPTANSGQTIQWDLSEGTHRGTSSSKNQASPGSGSLGYTHATTNRIAHVIAAFAGASSGTTINANTDALTLTENVATVKLSKNISASLATKAVTKFSAIVSLGKNISANLDVLSLQQYNAIIKLNKNVLSNTDNLTLIKYNAIAKLSKNVIANTITKTLSTYTASITSGSGTSIVANVVTKNLATYQASIEAVKRKGSSGLSMSEQEMKRIEREQMKRLMERRRIANIVRDDEEILALII